MSQLIGVDVGGTAIKLGRFSTDGELLAELERPTPQPAMPGGVVTAIVEAVAVLDPDRLASRVGVGLPGPMDAEARVARVCINLPGWQQIPLSEWLEPQLQRRVTLANDGNCALMGEAWRGAAVGYRDVLLLTLGTGVGGGVLLNGQLFSGHGGAAAEPGLISVDPEGPPCNSGNRGSLEQHCSISGLRRLMDVEPQKLDQLARIGDPEALAAWRDYGRWLGVGLSSLIYVLTPQLVLIGGGLSAATDHFLPSALAEVEQRVQAESRQGLEIRRAQLGNGAGRLGAARLALERLRV
ncbi:ROK family protein [Synechococcus sp. W4D4]|uniref:ROK family protein n=1 Tax=Synechococcus sp. W4D4 TaxID=3392294 RepID=UPI0039E8EDE7